MNRAELENKIKSLQFELSQAKEQLAVLPNKWDPKGGDYYINGYGDVVLYVGGQHSGFGTEYATQEQAEKAAKAMRAHNRLLAYVAEFAPDWVPDWADEYSLKAEVIFCASSGEWSVECSVGCFNPSAIYMPEHVAEDLAAKLNAGEVEL